MSSSPDPIISPSPLPLRPPLPSTVVASIGTESCVVDDTMEGQRGRPRGRGRGEGEGEARARARRGRGEGEDKGGSKVTMCVQDMIFFN